MASPPSKISLRILEVMKQHPQGITEGEIRRTLNISATEQANFGRRRRELNYHYDIEKRREGPNVLYVYKGPKEKPKDTAPISPRLRAQALHKARGRCGMCGRGIEKHGIELVIDHKIPRAWDGETAPENLWAICTDCNHGKKNYFESVDAAWMRKVMAKKSVHVRLGETLKAFHDQPVPMDTLEFVANQNDWKKRLRELRYLGWTIKTFNRKQPGGRVKSFYRLIESKPWPDDPTRAIREYERERAAQNKVNRS